MTIIQNKLDQKGFEAKLNEDKQRLVTEWLEHHKIVLAVDYDDTIYSWKHTSQKDCDKVIDLVKWCKTIGAHIVIHTASDKSRYPEILKFCQQKGLDIDSINVNAIKLPYGNEGKIYYNWQLCDRSGLRYAYEVLNRAAKEVATYKRRSIKHDEIG